MIKTHTGEVELKGSEAEICADLCIAIKAVRENVLAENHSPEEADRLIDMIVEDSKKTEEDIDKENVEIFRDLIIETLGDIVNIISRGKADMKEDTKN